jgi:hypothetical protein
MVGIALVASIVVATAEPQPIPDRAALLAVIRASNQHMLTSIESIHAVYDIVNDEIPSDQQPGAAGRAKSHVEWWQVGNDIRRRVESSSQVLRPLAVSSRSAPIATIIAENLIKDGEVRTWIPSPGSTRDERRAPQLVIKYHDRNQSDGMDLWCVSLFAVNGRPRLTLCDLLASPHSVKSFERVEVGGKAAYRMLLQVPPPADHYTIEIVVDPSKNYLVTYCMPISSSPKEVGRVASRVISAKEYDNGIFFPQHIETTLYAVGEDKNLRAAFKGTIRFRTEEINKSIPAHVFELPSPEGADVADHRIGSSYIMGKDGKPSGEFGVVPLITSPVEHKQASYSQVQSESSRPYVSILIGSVILGLVVGVATYRLKRRRLVRGAAR